MDITQISCDIKTEQKKRMNKYRKLLFCVIISAALMLCILLLSDLFASDIFFALRSELSRVFATDIASNITQNEITALAFEMLFTLVTMLVPIIPVCTVYGISPFRISKRPEKRDPTAWQYIPLAVGSGYLVSLVVNLFSGGIFDRFTEQNQGSLPETVPGIVMYYVLVAVFPAIFEEIAFRGVFLNSLLPYGKTQAIVVSAVIFGSMHVNPPQAIFAFAFGLIIGKLYTVTGNIFAGSIVHFLVNSISVTVSFLVSYYGSDNYSVTSIISIFIVAMMMAAVTFGVIRFVKYTNAKRLLQIGDMPAARTVTANKAFSVMFSLRNPMIYGIAPFLYIAMYIMTLGVRYYSPVFEACIGYFV